MTALVDLIAGLMTAWAVDRSRSPQSAVMAAAYLCSVFAAQYYDHENLRPILMAIDTFVIVAMADLWKRSADIQCRIIGTISMANIALCVLSVVSDMKWNTFASALNAASFVQIVIVGGFADGLMAWLGRSFERFTRRNNRLFRLVGSI